MHRVRARRTLSPAESGVAAERNAHDAALEFLRPQQRGPCAALRVGRCGGATGELHCAKRGMWQRAKEGGGASPPGRWGKPVKTHSTTESTIFESRQTCGPEGQNERRLCEAGLAQQSHPLRAVGAGAVGARHCGTSLFAQGTLSQGTRNKARLSAFARWRWWVVSERPALRKRCSVPRLLCARHLLIDVVCGAGDVGVLGGQSVRATGSRDGGGGCPLKRPALRPQMAGRRAQHRHYMGGRGASSPHPSGRA